MFFLPRQMKVVIDRARGVAAKRERERERSNSQGGNNSALFRGKVCQSVYFPWVWFSVAPLMIHIDRKTLWMSTFRWTRPHSACGSRGPRENVFFPVKRKGSSSLFVCVCSDFGLVVVVHASPLLQQAHPRSLQYFASNFHGGREVQLCCQHRNAPQDRNAA